MIDTAAAFAAFAEMVEEELAPVPVYVDPPVDPDVPYVMLYLIPGGGFWGPPLVAPEAEVDLVVQSSSVGESSRSRLQLAYRVRNAVLGRDANGTFLNDIALVGARVADRSSDGGPSGVEGGDAGENILDVPERFLLRIVNV